MEEIDPIAKSLETGDTVTIDIGDDILTLHRRPKGGNWEVGDEVYDRESGGTNKLIVVHDSCTPVNDVVQNGINIANANKNYNETDNAVYCIYKEDLLDSINEVPDNLDVFFRDGKFRVLNVKAYAFPSGRLKANR